MRESTLAARSGQPPAWLDRLEDDQIVFLGSACGEPQTLVEQLVEDCERWQGLRLLTGLMGSKAPYARAEYSDNFRLTTFMASSQVREAFAEGRADHVPASVFQVARLFAEARLHIDVALVQVSPPDDRGYCSLGVSVAYNRAAVSAAKVVVAEVNEQMPRTRGDGDIHVSEIDEFVTSDRPVLSVPAPIPSAMSDAIGHLVAEQIADGSVLQVGVGGVSDGIWRALGSHSDLSVHAGAAGDAVVQLLEEGVVTGKRALDPSRPVTAGQLIGTPSLYRYAHENDAFWLGQPDLTHNPAVLAGIVGYVSVVSALQVDLRGQVNSDTVRGQQSAGVGGALDFASGAAYAPGGCSIVALPSTHRGQESRIVSRLPDGVVTLPATLVDIVVTEHGVADLRGKSLAARCEALTAVAAPQFRDQLTKESQESW